MTDPLLIDVYVGDCVKPGQVTGTPDIAAVVAAGIPWCGFELKASQGLYYPNDRSNNPFYESGWFRTYYPLAASLAGDRLGVTWFRREYHYADLNQNPVLQARWNVSVVKSAGGFGRGDLATTVDVEDAGNPANPGKAAVEKWLKAYGDEMLVLTGIRPILYGNNYLHENHVDFQNCGCLALEVAHYSSTLPPEVYLGLNCPLSSVFGWQIIGTEGVTPVPAGYPTYTPLSSTHTEDYTAVIINGGASFEAGLQWMRDHCIPCP